MKKNYKNNSVKELDTLIIRLDGHENFVLIPIYFEAFDFSDLSYLNEKQCFKPDGVKYGHADKDDFCFAHIVSFALHNGKLIPIVNAYRNNYLRDI